MVQHSTRQKTKTQFFN
uniref:Uncharacterized protein n=1 Tax=Rhizophora mucronata TaxID=61149 RepID=A0A2P2J4P7_RHIMU